MLVKKLNDYISSKILPSDDDETVETVPRFRQVSAFAPDAHGHHFDEHLDSEESENEVIEYLSKKERKRNME